jgi:MFS family permease
MTQQTAAQENAGAASAPAISPWAPFGQRAFAFLWIATVVSNIGTWMHDVASGWLMTELSPSPMMVAAVQAATTLPVFLLALPAGALADIIDRRRLLLCVNIAMGLLTATFATLAALGAVTPPVLLLFTFLLGSGAAFAAPAWQSIVPRLVPREQLQAAIALNSTGINISRAIGPALSGFLIVSLGIAWPFALNAISYIGIIGALIWWRPASVQTSHLPPEHVGEAIITGLRHAFNNTGLRATLLRAAGFFLFASAYWSMLPLIARDQLGGGAGLYGSLLAASGAGAVLGAVFLPRLRRKLGPNRTVMAGTLGTAATLTALALVPLVASALVAALVTGFAWIMVLSTLNVSAQTSLPDWVRARGLAIFLTTFFGSMAAGSLIWGQVASLAGIPAALLIAAAGASLSLLFISRHRLNQGEAVDHAPSMHWPAPVAPDLDSHDRGPVMIQIAYEVAAENRTIFIALMQELRSARRRHGGYGWKLMQDPEHTARFVELWYEASWLQHLRHHERVTGSDRQLQEQIRGLLAGAEPPSISHYLGTAP